MIETTVRTYEFTDREIREILVEWMHSKGMHQPSYVGDTPCTKWTKSDSGMTVTWTTSLTDTTSQ